MPVNSEPETFPAAKANRYRASGAQRAEKGGAAGLLFGLAAYGLWGLLPIYFLLLQPADSVEIVANRVPWALLFCGLLVAVTKTWAQVGEVFRSRSALLTTVVGAGLIAVNWLILVYAVTNDKAIEASLGFFITPLITVLLGVFVLKEKLRPLQWAAIGIGFCAVVVLTVAYGEVPWIALALAFSFGLYGLVKKKGAAAGVIPALTVETIVLTPLAVATMVFLALVGTATVTNHGPVHFWLMAASGLTTALPLLLFAASTSRLTMTTAGSLQYITPVLQFLVAYFLFGETMTPTRWAGFAVVWLALVLLILDTALIGRKLSGAPGGSRAAT